MASSNIEWTDYTFNPWWGCTKLSAGCKNCYAEKFDARFKGNHWGDNATRKFFGENHWNQPVRWNKKAEKDGVRRRVFCASMSDVFEIHGTPDVNQKIERERMRLWELIIATPMLDWLLLTKRPENLALLPQTLLVGNRMNIWLGVTAENQKQADIRIPLLFKKSGSAVVRFVSYEPAIGPVNIDKYLSRGPVENGINWVIAGGESGHGARPMNEHWVRNVRDQCEIADVPFFLKQRLVNGKKVSMPTLDGRQWMEFPR